MTKRGCVNYAAAMAALVGVSLLASAAYLHATLARSDNIVPATGSVQVTDSVGMPTWAPLPGTLVDSPTASPTPALVPPDPGHGPIPVCWITGPRPGEPCPPTPTR